MFDPHKMIVLDGTDLWWLAQRGITFVMPVKANMALTVDARAQAAAGEQITNTAVRQPFEDYDDRSLIENCYIKAGKHQGDLDHRHRK